MDDAREIQRRQSELRTNLYRPYNPRGRVDGLRTLGLATRRPLPPPSVNDISTKEAALAALNTNGLLLRHLHPSLLGGNEEDRHEIELTVGTRRSFADDGHAPRRRPPTTTVPAPP